MRGGSHSDFHCTTHRPACTVGRRAAALAPSQNSDLLVEYYFLPPVQEGSSILLECKPKRALVEYYLQCTRKPTFTRPRLQKAAGRKGWASNHPQRRGRTRRAPRSARAAPRTDLHHTRLHIRNHGRVDVAPRKKRTRICVSKKRSPQIFGDRQTTTTVSPSLRITTSVVTEARCAICAAGIGLSMATIMVLGAL